MEYDPLWWKKQRPWLAQIDDNPNPYFNPDLRYGPQGAPYESTEGWGTEGPPNYGAGGGDRMTSDPLTFTKNGVTYQRIGATAKDNPFEGPDAWANQHLINDPQYGMGLPVDVMSKLSSQDSWLDKWACHR